MMLAKTFMEMQVGLVVEPIVWVEYILKSTKGSTITILISVYLLLIYFTEQRQRERMRKKRLKNTDYLII